MNKCAAWPHDDQLIPLTKLNHFSVHLLHYLNYCERRDDPRDMLVRRVGMQMALKCRAKIKIKLLLFRSRDLLFELTKTKIIFKNIVFFLTGLTKNQMFTEFVSFCTLLTRLESFLFENLNARGVELVVCVWPTLPLAVGPCCRSSSTSLLYS